MSGVSTPSPRLSRTTTRVAPGCPLGRAAKRFLVELGPDARAGLEDQQADRLAAVAQRQHEQAHAPVLAVGRIADHRTAAVVHLGLFARSGDDHGAGFRRLRPADQTIFCLIGTSARQLSTMPGNR